MGLREVAGDDASAEHTRALVLDRLAREEGEEVALAGAVETEHADALAEQHLGAERVDDAGEAQILDDDRALARPTTNDSDADGLVLWAFPRRGRVVATQLGVGRAEPAGERVGHL